VVKGINIIHFWGDYDGVLGLPWMEICVSRASNQLLSCFGADYITAACATLARAPDPKLKSLCMIKSSKMRPSA